MIRNGLIPELSEAFPVVRDENGKRICSFCHGKLPGRNLRWCSSVCRDEAYQRTNPGHMRFLVHRRDKGICASCGWDTEKWENVARAIKTIAYGWSSYETRDADALKCLHWFYETFQVLGYESRSLWEADHIKALIEGGENILSNMRTLCVPCHKRETKSLATRRAKERKRKKQSQLWTTPSFEEIKQQGVFEFA